jgi:hypothetical protein
MQTVSEFAVSVGYTVQAVNAKIRKLELILEPDPIDNRKRLLSPAQCELLRSYFPSKAGETTPVNTPPVYVEYQRPVEVGLVLAERSVSIGEISYQHQAPTNNPVLQLLQQRLSDRRTANASNLTKLQSFTAANAETQATIEAVEQLDAIESGEQKADRLFFLEQEAFNRRKESLQLAQLIPQSAPQPAPQPPAQAQSSGKPARNLYEEQGMPF